MIDIDAPGSCHDSNVFKDFKLGTAFLETSHNIPEPIYSPKSSQVMPYFLVAFPLHKMNNESVCWE